jgi:hypothetical protein
VKGGLRKLQYSHIHHTEGDLTQFRLSVLLLLKLLASNISWEKLKDRTFGIKYLWVKVHLMNFGKQFFLFESSKKRW